MSYEFGDNGSGFFHNKIDDALEDAKTGTTDGAKLMATILEPLSAIAFRVSAEEAGDAGPESVVQTISDSLEALQQAINAMRFYVNPAREMTARAIAGMLKDKAVVTLDKSGPRKGSAGTVEVKKSDAPRDVPYDIERMAISLLAGNMTVTGYRTSELLMTYYVHRYPADSTEGMRHRITQLERELAAAKLGITHQSSHPALPPTTSESLSQADDR